MAFIPSYPPVYFGFGALTELAGELAARGVDRPLIISDKGLVEHGVYKVVRDSLPADMAVAMYGEIPENPTIAGIDAALAVYKAEKCNGIIALGGGSVLDSGKALRVVAVQGGEVMDYLKDPSIITKDVAPYITIPTTAGTGAEITFGGGIHPETNAPAMGIRSPNVKPDAAIVDPTVTLTLPPRLTAATGMDALTHCVEGYLSNAFNPPAEAIALDGIRRVVDFVERATADGSDRVARSEMAMAALQGGMAIYMGLGPIHALSMAFGDSPLHHGTLVTVAMPAVMRFYNGRNDVRLAQVAEAMRLTPDADAGNRIADATAELNKKLGLPATVRKMGYDKNDIERMIDDAHGSYFNHAAPVAPSRDDYVGIVTEVLG
ncbi:MAG: iron-containing alcohol dehydrogenase [Rhodospirillaceae bacterium]